MPGPPNSVFPLGPEVHQPPTGQMRLRSDRHRLDIPVGEGLTRQRRRGPSAAMVRRRQQVASGFVAVALIAVILGLAWRLVDASVGPTPTAALTGPVNAAGPVKAGVAAPKASAQPVVKDQPTSSSGGRISLSRVPASGSGRLVTVPSPVGSSESGRKVRVRIEEGLAAKMAIDPKAFATLVLATLNDSRSWRGRGGGTFVQTADSADFDVVLATPATVDQLRLPLRTGGEVSCGWSGSRAVLNALRWADGTKEFSDIMQYRQYLINHEVGHVLGYHHLECGGRGQLAPVMQQQTKGVAPCKPNAWPFP